MNDSTFQQLVERRRSCRAYAPDPVPKEHIEAMLEAARMAPSACNMQPWRFAVVTAKELRERLAAEGLLPGISMRWVAEAPVVIALGIEKSTITHRVAPRISGVDYSALDIGIAGEHLVLRATELGLGTCWIGWINQTAVRRIVGWGRGIRPQALITVGRPKEEERRERSRLPMEKITKWV